jgi:hypothetical protein
MQYAGREALKGAAIVAAGLPVYAAFRSRIRQGEQKESVVR